MYCNQKPENWIEYEMDLDPPTHKKQTQQHHHKKKTQTKQIKKSKNEKENLRKSKKETKKNKLSTALRLFTIKHDAQVWHEISCTYYKVKQCSSAGRLSLNCFD